MKQIEANGHHAISTNAHIYVLSENTCVIDAALVEELAKTLYEAIKTGNSESYILVNFPQKGHYTLFGAPRSATYSPDDDTWSIDFL